MKLALATQILLRDSEKDFVHYWTQIRNNLTFFLAQAIFFLVRIKEIE